MASERETEFVFLATAGQHERLLRVLRDLSSSVRIRPLRRLRDQYLDTPTLLLARSGIACRLRQVDGRATLTLKSLTRLQKGLADRVELSEDLALASWSWPGPLPASRLRARLLPLARRVNVNRVLELVQERRVYDVLTQEGARLEVSADRAEIAGTDHVLQRIEVEGAPGDKEALARWAAKLRRRLRLKPARKSKFERGLLAIGLRLPDPADAPALRLRAGDTVRRAAARTSSRYFRRMQWYLPGTRLGLDPEYLHQMRVCVRRLRAVLRLFRSALPPAATSALAGELRWLGHSLGAVRDLDVLLRRCDAETRASSGAACRAADACRHEMSRRRDKAYAALRRDLAGARFRALAKMCRSYVARLRCPVVGGGGKVAELGARAMRSELRKILRDGRTITAETPAPVLHRLRIRCKRLRYACDLLSEIHGKPVARMSRRIGKLQEVLGAYQDAVSAQVLLARAAEEAPDTPARADIVAGLERCAAGWHREQAIRRTAFPEAWARFDRKKARQAFLKALRGGKPAVRG